ncbi:MAG: IS21-like element helper ATPase IstB, partial [Bacillota bacterium]|nr:IS21-like element helper ATPase IstB [Bacillota bacterium]
MLSHQTAERLRQMRLWGMADAFLAQLSQPDAAALSFEERFGLLVDEEVSYRDNRRLKRLLKEAKLRQQACLEDIDLSVGRGLERQLLRSLGTGLWITNHQNVLVSGPTGVGKTYVSCALANAACRQGFSARYYRVPRLLTDIAVSRGDGSYTRLLKWLSKVDVLVLDDWGLTPLTATDGRELLEVIEDRCQARSTVVTSQVPVDQWHAVIGDPSVADAILDRLVH